MKKLICSILVMLTIPVFAQAELKWDSEVKVLNWYDANAFCKSKGMRLPTKDELIQNVNNPIFNHEGAYWSSTAPNPLYPYTVNMDNGEVIYIFSSVMELRSKCVN